MRFKEFINEQDKRTSDLTKNRIDMFVGRRINYNSKDDIISAVLTVYKKAVLTFSTDDESAFKHSSLKRVLNTIIALRDLGYDYSELESIEKSLKDTIK